MQRMHVHDARVFKSGNSLAIRIPTLLAKEAELDDGCAIEIVVEEGTLRIRKAPSRELTDLIERITPENAHGPLFEETVGVERW